MTYEEFRAAFMAALRESKLPMIGLHVEETTNARTMSRRFEVHVEPVGGSDAEPFHVAAALWWNWDALFTARTAFSEDEMLTEMFGRDGALTLLSERRRLRIDIKFTASLRWGSALPMPPKAAWSAWVRETIGRLEDIEPLTPLDHVADNDDGELVVMAWQGMPKAEVACDKTGDLQLESVSVSAMQIMQFPRTPDEPYEAPAAPEQQLREMFQRVRAALIAWMQALDHLKKTTAASTPRRPY